MDIQEQQEEGEQALGICQQALLIADICKLPAVDMEAFLILNAVESENNESYCIPQYTSINSETFLIFVGDDI